MNKMKSKLSLAFFVFFCFLPGSVLAQRDTLSFLQITDLHVILNRDGYHPGMMDYRREKQYDQGESRLRQFLQNVTENTNTDLVIATGDLIDFFEAENKSGEFLDIQIVQFSQLLDEYQAKILLALGNHDIFTFHWQDSSLKVNQDNSGRARAAWIRNVSCFKNGTYYSESFSVGRTTYKFIFLDDSFYWFLPEEKFEVPYIDKSQLYWLNAQLQESENDVEIIFMHIPLNDPIAQTEYSKELYSVLSGNPSVRLILSGHQHKNIIREYNTTDDRKIFQVQTGALVLGEENWRLIRLTENNILVSVPGRTENEIIIPLK